MDSQLVSFLKNYELNKEDTNFTHTSQIRPKRKYNIPDSDIDKFFNIYNKVISEDGIASVTERPPPVVPLIVDIDLKHSAEDGIKRYYKPQHLQNLIAIYQEIIKEITVEYDERNLYCCVLEKTGPIEYNGLCKDGFHLHFPYFFTEHWVQKEYIRSEVIKRVEMSKIFDDLKLKESLDKVFDKNIPSLTWIMYGSRKEVNLEAYKATKYYNHELTKIGIKAFFKAKYEGDKQWNLPRYLSIRGNNIATPLNKEIEQLKSITKERKKEEYSRDLDKILEDILVAEQLMSMVSSSRADNFTEWIEMGWILFNISEGHQKGFELWNTFSMQSDKYNEGECEKLWSKMNVKNYTIGTLKHIAKLDSPNEYSKWTDDKINHILQNGISMAHNDVAKIVHLMFNNKYVCADIEKDIWYEFRNHRWHRDIKGITLRKELSNSLSNKYAALGSYYFQKIQETDDAGQKQMYNAKVLCIGKLIDKLKNNSFKNAVIKECMEYFYDPHFIEKMDENPFLMVFENGVYDSKNKIFRPGRPDDYCTKTTGHPFHVLDKSDKRLGELMNILEKIFINPKLFRFFKQTVSDLVRGGNRHKIFVIWTGDGDNGKSVCADLLERAFGEYYYTPSTTLLTGKQQNSSGATADLIPCKGARIVVISETGNNDVLNCGIMKKLTGNDPFYARGLFKEPIKINPQFKLILHCNKLPNVSAEDKASWNRIRVLPFESKFYRKNDDKVVIPNTIEEQREKKIFPMDRTLKEKLNDYVDIFLSWIINEYEEIGDAELYEPAEVSETTTIYQKSNDFYMQFIDERINETKIQTDYMTLTALYNMFKEWFKDSFPGNPIPNKTMVKESMEKKLGKCAKGIWYGIIPFNPEDTINDVN
jgi:P4 family phage/plasmid primase-like protien